MATNPTKRPRRALNKDPQFVGNRSRAVSAARNPPNVEFIRAELAKMIPQYDKIRDCIDGEDRIKERTDVYLPRPNVEDTSPGNFNRYRAYLLRAVFYNVVRRTLSGYVGQVFAQPPVIEVPTLLDPVVKDATGAGVTLEQLAKFCEALVMAYGRLGVLADYPKTEGPTTRAEQAAGNVRPTITAYAPWDCINWRYTVRGGRRLLSLVVLRETFDKEDDGFETKTDVQYRVLRLDTANVYSVEIWRRAGEGSPFAPVAEKGSIPTDSTGKTLSEIPFKFIGAENNDADVDAAPLYDMASINVAHYRNSADYEESVFMLGQPTPWFAGLTEQWVKEVMGGVVVLGSRSAISLPEGGSAGLLQAEANTLAYEAMQHKERQMVALGAQIVQEKVVQRTATEDNNEEASEASVLTTATKNVSAGLLWILEWCGIFCGAVTERGDAVDATQRKIKFELNTEFAIAKMDAEQIRSTIEAWIKEAISKTEMRKRLRQTGLAYLDDDAYEEEVEKDKPKPGDPDYVETRYDEHGNPLPARKPGEVTPPPLPKPPEGE